MTIIDLSSLFQDGYFRDILKGYDIQMDFTTWGIDWNGPAPSPDTQALVEVPALPPGLQDTYETQLRSNIDPFRTSEVYGIDIYMEALTMVQAIQALPAP